MVVVVDIRLEGSGVYLCWTGDRVLGVCAALCVCRTVAVVERGHFLNDANKAKSMLKKIGKTTMK